MPPHSSNSSAGAQTQVETVDPLPHPRSAFTTVTLRLRGVPAERRHIRWATDVIDNEGLGRKSSKRMFFSGSGGCVGDRLHGEKRSLTNFRSCLVCCIYHKERAVGESSDEDSDSSSSSDSDEASDGDGADDGRARMGGQGKRKSSGHQHGDGEEGCRGGEGSSRKGKERTRRTARNAYEKAPKNMRADDVKK